MSLLCWLEPGSDKLIEEYTAVDEYITLGCNYQTNNLPVQQQDANQYSTSYSGSQIVRLALHLVD